MMMTDLPVHRKYHSNTFFNKTNKCCALASSEAQDEILRMQHFTRLCSGCLRKTILEDRNTMWLGETFQLFWTIQVSLYRKIWSAIKSRWQIKASHGTREKSVK